MVWTMFELSEKVVCCNRIGGITAAGDFPLRLEQDDVSSLGDTLSADRKPMPPANFDHLVINSDHLDESEFRDGTLLFSAIEKRQWEKVLSLLETGQESGCFLCGLAESTNINNNNAKTSDSQQADIKTWVVSKDWWGKQTSARSLPIHAAVIQKAPTRIIQKLIELYPEGARSQDLDGNLPLHLSFKHESPDSVVAILLKSFPEAVGVKNKSGQEPVDFATAESGAIIQLCVEQTNRAAEKEEARLCQVLESEKTRLTEILLQLSEIRGELDLLRTAKKNKNPADYSINHNNAHQQDKLFEGDLMDNTDFAPGVVKGLFPDDSQNKKKTGNSKVKLSWVRK